MFGFVIGLMLGGVIGFLLLAILIANGSDN